MIQSTNKPTKATLEAFEAMIPAEADRKKMFGMPSAFMGGNMFCGVYQNSVVFRLPEAEREELLRLEGAGPFVAQGRTMKEYVAIDGKRLPDKSTLRAWAKKSLAYAASMPVKTAKPRKTSKPAAKSR
jgi:TfoX/Sxy family transcriptional regulator of competence genes